MTIEFAKLARIDIMLVYDLNALLILLRQMKCLFAKMLTIFVIAAVNIRLVYKFFMIAAVNIRLVYKFL